jgi:cytidylate kinase
MITFICGQLCSGKTFYSQILSDATKGVFVEVGDIVRTFKSSQDRRVLQDSEHLSTKIVETIDFLLKFHKDTDLFVSGVRQKEILEAFPQATLIWIECPTSTRKDRYVYRDRIGDEQNFDEADKGDERLGILEVKRYIYQQNNYIITV